MLFAYRKRTLLREMLFIAGAVVFSFPLYLLAGLSLKSDADVLTSPLSFPTNPEWSNYQEAWSSGSGLGSALVTSTVITVSSVVALIAIGVLAAYAIARGTAWMGNTMFLLFLLGLLIPVQLGTIPLYTYMRHLDLIGTPLGVIIANVGQHIAVTIFLFTGFIRNLPRDYEEAAQVDGAGQLRTLARVVLPLLRPIIATVAIIDGLIVWNDFFLPLLWLGGSGHQTLPVALYGFVGEFVSQWNLIFAGIVIVIGPILLLYIITQRYMIRGFQSGIRG